MKIEPHRKHKFVAVLKNFRGIRKIPLLCNSLKEAEVMADELNLAKIERASASGIATAAMIHKLVNSSLRVDEAYDRWYAWLSVAMESQNTVYISSITVLSWIKAASAKRCQIDAITEDDLDRWVNRPDGIKASSRKQRLNCLRSFFGFCHKKGYTTADVSSFIRVKFNLLTHEQKERRQKRLFTDEEYDRLLTHLRTDRDRVVDLNKDRAVPHTRHVNRVRFWAAAVIIGRHTALRISDIAALQWASISDGRIVVHTDKCNTRVDQAITPEVVAALAEIPRTHKKWCFPEQALIISTPSCRCNLSSEFGASLKASGIGGHHFHELRATRITELSRSGQPNWAIAAFAGHTNVASTEDYIVKESA